MLKDKEILRKEAEVRRLRAKLARHPLTGMSDSQKVQWIVKESMKVFSKGLYHEN